MMTPNQKERPALAASALKSQLEIHDANSTPQPRKWQRVLAAFLAGRNLNRFEAVRELKDWCLHSTVSGLEARGVHIDRQDEVVTGQFGAVHCKRYRLAPESFERARELLGLDDREGASHDAAPVES